MITLEVNTRSAWRKWLEKNHAHATELWLVFHKGGTGRPTLEYEAAVEEALCFGWIDSIVRRLDDEHFIRKFTPRKDAAKWSELNLKRFARMKEAGLVTEAGLRVYAPGKPLRPVAPARVKAAIPSELIVALRGNPKAGVFFDGLAQSYRNQYIGWISAAKRPETRAKRVAETVALLAKGQKLGLK